MMMKETRYLTSNTQNITGFYLSIIGESFASRRQQ